jgi:hypothetical protein
MQGERRGKTAACVYQMYALRQSRESVTGTNGELAYHNLKTEKKPQKEKLPLRSLIYSGAWAVSFCVLNDSFPDSFADGKIPC